jgi:hypothetical protein
MGMQQVVTGMMAVTGRGSTKYQPLADWVEVLTHVHRELFFYQYQ